MSFRIQELQVKSFAKVFLDNMEERHESHTECVYVLLVIFN